MELIRLFLLNLLKPVQHYLELCLGHPVGDEGHLRDEDQAVQALQAQHLPRVEQHDDAADDDDEMMPRTTMMMRMLLLLLLLLLLLRLMESMLQRPYRPNAHLPERVPLLGRHQHRPVAVHLHQAHEKS
jgi:hypothetical protein